MDKSGGNKSKTLILIDGHALAFRQYYALERTNMKTNDGTPTWAVYGFFKAIFDLLKNPTLAVDAIGVAFDVSHHTFRTETYDEYKSNREAMPDAMQIQMELIYQGLQAFNIPIYTKPGFEADDVIGTISKQACELGHKVLILTGDQDSFQLVEKNGCVKVILPSKGELLEYDWQKVYDKLGVYPNQIIDYKALRGDTSDNIPGVRGIGEKTAVKLLEEYKTVDNVLANIENISSKSIKEKLQNGIEQAKMSKFLATIVRDVDIEFDFDKTKIELPDITNVSEFLKQMQFYSFLKNIEYILKTFNRENTEVKIPEISAENTQLGLFAQAVKEEINEAEIEFSTQEADDIDALVKFVDILKKQTAVSFKIFADIKNACDFEIFGIAFGIPNGKKTDVYWIKPFDIIETFKLITPILENSEIKKVTDDVKNDLNILRNYNCALNGIAMDTTLGAYVKNSSQVNEFDVMCMNYLNHIMPTIVTNAKKGKLCDCDNEFIKNYVGDYLARKVELSKYWESNIDDIEFKVWREVEISLTKVLSEMEVCGVCVDRDYLKTLSEKFDNEIEKLGARIYELAGEEFNINSPKQVGTILFEKLEIKSPKKRGKSKNSTSAEVLNALAPDNEIVRLILEYRKYSKLKSTYTDALPSLINPQNGRIHTSYNQTTTTTGRLSSSNPNLQNIPIRTKEGNLIRQAFVPTDRQNYKILSADYSQIELRLLAHVSQDVNLINTFNSGIDVHTLTASKIFEVPVDKVTKEMRYKSITVNFGIVYGQSKYGLAKALKITPQEAESFIDKYFQTYPRIKDYMNKMVSLVEKQGYVETIFGRKRYLQTEINSSNAMIREFAKRAAINHPMQGSSADLIKMAMVDFSKKLSDNKLDSKLIMQVHDELVVEVKNEEFETVKELVTKSMELGQILDVKLEIDINAGDSWKES